MSAATTPQPPKTETLSQAAVTSVGIVGGGKAGQQLAELFLDTPLTRLAYVVDRAADAPGIRTARDANVPTFADLDAALATIAVDYIFEVTGSDTVVRHLRQALAERPTDLITHDMAQILTVALQKQRTAATQTLIKDVREIQEHVARSLSTVSSLAESIKESTSGMRILSLNARIEAARAGQVGKGFAVVAQRMEAAADTVRDLTVRIEQINEAMHPVIAASSRLEVFLEQLI
jgi:methyl-accepting chemotaxis protein